MESSDGSVLAFALMCLFMEYIVLVVFLYLGFYQLKLHQYKGGRLGGCDNTFRV